MPYINYRVGSSLTESQKEIICSETTNFMNLIMRKKRGVTVVHIEESSSQQWSVNGSCLSDKEPIPVYVDIKVTEGTNTPEEKSDMLRKTMEMLKSCIGVTQEACYIVIDDIPSNSWGYDGFTQEHRASAKR